MKKGINAILAFLWVGLLVAGCCPKNPQLNSAIAAHGNTDWHIDTANEFLFGTDMGGAVTAPNHCPDTWSRRHIHVGLTDTNHFYYDQDLITSGDDTDSTNGIDKAMLFFYAGHGHPEFWNTLGNDATQPYLRLGDCQNDNKGVLRYYWQCSCEVFAHGPRTCAGAGFDYACPGSFDGSPDSIAMRNVYERWGGALSPKLRMACGASTPAYCHESEANRIWNGYNNDGLGVADAFIEGLNVWGVVPLCITLGGADVNATPLVTDAVFTNQPNTAGTTHYHIQYLSNFASEEVPLRIEPLPDMRLPVYRLIPLPLPEELQKIKLAEEGRWMIGKADYQQQPVEVHINRVSGAIYLKGQKAPSTKKALTEKEYIEKAQRLLNAYGLSEKEMIGPQGYNVMLDSAPVEEGKGGAEQRVQKSATVRYKRFVDYQGSKISVIGDGGTITVRMNNDGSLRSATKIWRPVADVKALVSVKPYAKALKEAEAQLGNKVRYKLHDWDWGYKELDGNFEQKQLQVVYQFAFAPKTNEDLIEFPPRLIEIQAQRQ